ncbi:ATP synthase subunit I [Nostoc sp. CENA67]|uniref:ATP synthase subunit I n=1 Tax=Amazonocrinis nigriterrae CENA67 TaxID=2794033 RepID=A0A8J7HPC6_9NOST|nr:ATP synthase subunit I [Amazonocrinis nigriterrae]MBH8560960.1 ATP synthase subunit I [Amazonocrinis nigriterrae CENA67]BAZ48087.1 putative ATP synthase protein I [Nostoc sp. NIES-4103]
MSLSDESVVPAPTTGQDAISGSEDTESDNSMGEFYQLYQKLLVITLVLTGIIFISVWIFYSLNIALNYLIGACTGVVYLKMLAKDVERLGGEKKRLSKTRFALFIGLIVLATQWRELQILPIFLGFLTYKATLLVYMVQTAFIPDS